MLKLKIKIVVLTPVTKFYQCWTDICEVHEYHFNEDLEETHRYAIVGVAIGIIPMITKYLCQKYKHEFKLQVHLCIRNVLQGYPIICIDYLDGKKCLDKVLPKNVLIKFYQNFRERLLLTNSRDVIVEEQIALFLMTIDNSERISYKNGFTFLVKQLVLTSESCYYFFDDGYSSSYSCSGSYSNTSQHQILAFL